MNLNYNSFFVRKFLQCNQYDLPNTVCDLAKRIMIWTVIWSVLAFLVGVIAVAYLSGLWNTLVVIFTDTTWAMLSEKANSSVLVFFVMTNSIAVLAGWFGGIALKDYLHRKYFTNRSEPSTPSPSIQFVSELWSRIRDKTCRVIEYENHPEDIRKAQYVEYQAQIAALKAGQDANNSIE